MSDDDDLFDDPLDTLEKASKPSRQTRAKEPRVLNAGLDLKALMQEQVREKKKIEQIRKASEEETARLAAVTASNGELDMLGGREGMDLHDEPISDGELEALNQKMQSIDDVPEDEEDEEEGDMERDELVDWMGLGSVFAMDLRQMPSLTSFASAISDRWGDEFAKLHAAFRRAEHSGKLADLLCVLGPVRWLRAKRQAAPPSMLDWLLALVALSDCHATAHGAFLNFKALFVGEDIFEPYGEGLARWSLSFTTVARIMRCYGVILEPKRACHITAFVRRIDTQSKREPEPQRGEVPPIGNLRSFMTVVLWAVRDGRVSFSHDETVALVQACLIMCLDRYVQAGCPDTVREVVLPLLERLVQAQNRWPAPTISNILAGVFDQKDILLSDASLLHIGRSILPESDRGKDLLAAWVKRLLEHSCLPPTLAAELTPICPMTEAETYLSSLLNILMSPDADDVFEDLVRALYVCYCLDLMSKASRGRVSKCSLLDLSQRFKHLVMQRLPNTREEEMQMAKDLLDNEIKTLQKLAPKQVQAKLSSFLENPQPCE